MGGRNRKLLSNPMAKLGFAVFLAFALAFGFMSAIASVQEAAAQDSASNSVSLSDGSYVEGEAVIVYHSSATSDSASASDASMATQSESDDAAVLA